MRTAIKTYQTAGVVEDDQGPEIAQAQPQQPSPGAAGPTTPATPPPPAKAFNPDELVKPAPVEPTTDPDKDMNIMRSREDFVFDPENLGRKNVLSHEGDHRPLADVAGREQYHWTLHPDYPNYEEIMELADKWRKIDPQTGQPRNAKLADKFEKQANRLQDHMMREQTAKFKDAYDKVKQSHAEDLRGIKGSQLPINMQEGFDDKVIKAIGSYQTAKYPAKPATQLDLENNEEARRASPLVTLNTEDQNKVIRDFVTLNQNQHMGIPDAVTAMMDIGSAVKPGAKGHNGLSGRAAARFRPWGVDAIGNRFVQMPDGNLIRMSPTIYDILSRARHDGYNKAAEYRADLQKKREDYEKAGVLGKALQSIGLQ